MPKYRKKPVVIEAVQWHKNGDHPLDNCHEVHPDPESATQFESFLSEGEVVGYYRHPDVHGQAQCGGCGRIMNDHGWIDTLEGGLIVCPGDWIITGVAGEVYPCKPEIFAQTYDAVPDEVAPGDHQHKIAGILRVVREKGYGHADLYIDGELFPYATVGGFQVCPRRDQMPGVSVTIAGWRVEVADGNIPEVEHQRLTAAGGDITVREEERPQGLTEGSGRPGVPKALRSSLDVQTAEPGDGGLRGDIEM